MPPWSQGPSIGNPFPSECCCNPQPDDGYYDLYDEGGVGGCECCGGATRTVTITATEGDQPLIGPAPADGTLCSTYGPDGARGPRWSELVGVEIVMNNISALFPGEADNMCRTFDFSPPVIAPFDQAHTLTTQSVRYDGSTEVTLNVQRFWSENGIDQCPDCAAVFRIFATYRCESIRDHTAGMTWVRHELGLSVVATDETDDCYSPLSNYQSQGHWSCEDDSPWGYTGGGFPCGGYVPCLPCEEQCTKTGWEGNMPDQPQYNVTHVNLEKP